ncbi:MULTISPECIES: hypothetical protein [Halorussus]|uniref:hypothetical protein n=1 Tax=Halorussus TaxID=1070314 RepID=UPI00209EDD8A|nr:hypothetical protein [Halorussus vallis]USZ75333.1 hypothetical protein NGM07_18105 [Halorussus vallis]
MRRRRLLAALGMTALPATLAGCVGSDALETTTDPPATRAERRTRTASRDDRTGTDDRTPTAGDVTVHSLAVRPSVVVRGVHFDPHYRPGSQFVVADVSVGGRADLSGIAVGKAFAVTADGRRVDREVYYPVELQSGDPQGVRLGFAVPAPLDADGASVVWRGDGNPSETEWPLGDELLDALANPPAFEVRRFEVPAEANRGATFEATLTIENVGRSDGTFLAELGATTVSDTPEIAVDVPSGETVTATRTVEPHYPEGVSELEIRLNWGASALTRTVSVE